MAIAFSTNAIGSDKASTVAAREPTKYALNRVQLRGRADSVLASDQRQLFQEGGFHFPFTEDLLISRSGLFGLPPFAESKIVGIGRTETHLAIRVGPWTFAFFIDKQGRFVGSMAAIEELKRSDS
ncbi:MAG: hypothetical protein K8T89_26755 [Planctomycetes bacterium]|nr:hypothetical protein [Planctomycetota bacterium]